MESCITPIWQPLCSESDIQLPVSGQNKSNIKGLKGYYYEEMMIRLNSVNKKEICSVGYFLRKLWKKYEHLFVVHDAEVFSEWHEQKIKEKRKEFEKKCETTHDEFKEDNFQKKCNYKKGNIRFAKNESGVWGVYSDLLYDTYQKDWTKAYEGTFHEFFHGIDLFSNPCAASLEKRRGFSHEYKDPGFCFMDPGDKEIPQFCFYFDEETCQFGEVVARDVRNLVKSTKIGKIHKDSNKHNKAYLYDAIGGALYFGRYPSKVEPEHEALFAPGKNQNYEQCGHRMSYWLGEGITKQLYYCVERNQKYYFIKSNRGKEAVEKLKKLVEYKYKNKKNDIYEDINERLAKGDYRDASGKIEDVKRYIDWYFKEGTVPEENQNEEMANIFIDIAAVALRVADDEDKTGEEIDGLRRDASDIIKKLKKPFLSLLAMEIFAGMAALAVVNPKALEAMEKEYMPNSYRMFKDILGCMLVSGK
ncbi:MAG: hypothetical protein LBH25_05680 [Fibromonadaceae bacterium]|jgi:hypothetical protein|nr:hypothetical protein [Fibromonadaceae bacterium]